MPKRHKPRPDATDRIATDLDEIHLLIEGFEQELQKLDEALEALSAYLLRLQCQPLSGRLLH
jgi:prefoldin subunit 5